MALTSHLMHKHYCENDVEGILAWFDDRFLWFGAGEEEYAAGTETVKAIFRQFAGKVPKCNISDEQYDAISIARARSSAPAGCGSPPTLPQTSICACISASPWPIAR